MDNGACGATEEMAMSREIRYWQETGFALGIERYRRYLRLFGLDEDSFVGQVVCDYGCGPFGGVLSVLRGVRAGYPVDVLAETYNAWGALNTRIGRSVEVPTRSCDAVFCLNVLDHTPDPRAMQAELARISKPGASLYLFAHLRQVTKGHYRMTSRKLDSLFGLARGIDHPRWWMGLREPE